MLHKKSLGQHFLRNPHILQKIADAARLAPDDTVLEVGPGEGTLTELLLQRAGKVIAVEKDDRLIPHLQTRFAAEIAAEKLQLIHGDILALPTNYLLPTTYYKVVANLPYYITGAFLRKFLQEIERQPASMTLLLQKEVAKRIVAADKKESLLSISVKCYGAPCYIATVKAGSFSPPPKVDSAILAIENISKEFFVVPSCHSSPEQILQNQNLRGQVSRNPEVKEKGWVKLDSRFRGNDRKREGNDTEKRFFSLLKQGFAHPRKLLASNLGVAPETLAACDIATNARAENLSPAQWKSLAIYQSANEYEYTNGYE